LIAISGQFVLILALTLSLRRRGFLIVCRLRRDAMLARRGRGAAMAPSVRS